MVDELLAIIGEEGEDISALLTNPTATVEATTTQETTEELVEVEAEAATETSSTEIPEGV